MDEFMKRLMQYVSDQEYMQQSYFNEDLKSFSRDILTRGEHKLKGSSTLQVNKWNIPGCVLSGFMTPEKATYERLRDRDYGTNLGFLLGIDEASRIELKLAPVHPETLEAGYPRIRKAIDFDGKEIYGVAGKVVPIDKLNL